MVGVLLLSSFYFFVRWASNFIFFIFGKKKAHLPHVTFASRLSFQVYKRSRQDSRNSEVNVSYFSVTLYQVFCFSSTTHELHMQLLLRSLLFGRDIVRHKCPNTHVHTNCCSVSKYPAFNGVQFPTSLCSLTLALQSDTAVYA